ncbi:hypothetical protein N7532_004626 [Penicillium argentinense]|uniref:BZIP transcription factor n=1 Tax=Penicillium argentinense TaxID=1131581 RepID=A0A9W9FPQ7_9EURO|nr:uncharacterized protein N7532_004626 [Penicillium argentinense]KAJ5104097.1 hypothetical protein N7532_004626 [Penicillium argentinense]
MSDLSSAERKRVRDRRAQQTLRNKKLRHTVELEVQVAHCEQYHNEKGVQHLLAVIESLRKQNEALVARQRALRSMVNSWDERLEQTTLCDSPTAHGQTNGEPRLSTPLGYHTFPEPLDGATCSLSLNNLPTSVVSPLQQSPKHHKINDNVDWNKLPLYSDDFSRLRTVTFPWFAHIEQITPCPDTPESPLDLLYGSNTNPLANMIHMALERRPCRDPERLAMGWIVYHFSRWVIAPSPRTYENLPRFLRPVKDQLQIEHPIALSCVPWPSLRSNMIRQWQLYENNRDDFFGLFACCIKIRWPWGVKVLERNEENEIRIKPAFYQTFMKEEGWGITQEFINEHPNLMVGIDVSSLLFNMT